MVTEERADSDAPQYPDAFSDAWAAVFIDVYEKLKARGELPPDDEAAQSKEGAPPCPST